jgi:phospholipase C
MKPKLQILLLFAGLAVVGQAQTTISHFQHIIVVVQENRTPDNLFYELCTNASNACSTTIIDSTHYDIQTGQWKDGSSSTGFTTPVAAPINNGYDLNHSHTGWLEECDPPHPTRPFSCTLPTNLPPTSCMMDGASCTAPNRGAYIFVDNSTGTITPYLTLATSYGWANFMFQTNQGPSFPAHQFLFGGTSALSATGDAGGTFVSENFAAGTSNPPETWAGCYAQDGETTELVGPDSKETTYTIDHATGTLVCIPSQANGGRDTMADLLDDAGLSWTYYSSAGGGTDKGGSIWTAPNALRNICVPNAAYDTCTGTEWKNHVVINPSQVLTDMGANGGACNLKNVSWVIPTSANSDHPGGSTGGPAWVANIINTLGQSGCKNSDGTTYWDTTAVVVTWDDFGGFYDHEPPTIEANPEGGYQLGFRVPLIFVSAYTPVKYINNNRHDFGTILRFIEHNYSLTEGALGFADARANTDLTEFYDLTKVPRMFVPIPSAKSALDFINDKTPNGVVDDD